MRVWVHCLVAAGISGTASAVSAAFAVPSAVNLSGPGLIAMGKVAVAGALLSVFAYLKQSPLPPTDKPEK